MAKSTLYSESYKDKVFFIWYKMGRPSAPRLKLAIPDERGNVPGDHTLKNWCSEWEERANSLDQQALDTMDTKLIQEKVEMLHRHTQVAEKMQSLAVEEIEAHLIGNGRDPDWLTASAAIRLLVEGIRIERESRGIPGMLQKIANRTDEEILDDIKGLVEKSYKKTQYEAETIDGEFV